MINSTTVDHEIQQKTKKSFPAKPIRVSKLRAETYADQLQAGAHVAWTQCFSYGQGQELERKCHCMRV